MKKLIDLIESKPTQVELDSLEIIEQLKIEVHRIKLVQKILTEQVKKLHSKIYRLLLVC